MKRILVISWFFPPINSSEGLVTYKLLNNSKYQYDVFSQTGNESWSYGKDNYLKIGKNIHCIGSNVTNMDAFKSEVVEYFKKNQNKYDIVMTRSMAEVSHIIGLEIKRIKPNILWIASFGDPIGNNPFTLRAIRSGNPYSLKQRYTRPMGIREIVSLKRIIKSYIYGRRNKKQYNLYIKNYNELQYNIINECDYVIYNNEYQKEYMLKEYSKKEQLEKKTIILPHSYDSSLYNHTNEPQGEKIIFSFVGHLDDIRTPKALLEAINKLSIYDPNLKNKAEFRFYGNMGANDKLYLLDNDLLDVVKIRKSVNYLESLKIMEESNWLINIDANISDIIDNNIFFAAKISDYIGANRQILGITMDKGPSAEIFRKYNAVCVENCADLILNYLYLIVYENYSKTIDQKYRKEFDAKNVARKFDELISKL